MFVIFDYQCPDCGIFESMERRPAPESVGCKVCGQESHRRMPAPMGKMAYGSVTSAGYSMNKHSDLPKALDTSALADGMPTGEWKQRRAEWRRDRRIADIRSKI